MAEPTIKKKFYAEDDTTVVLIKGYGEGGGGGSSAWDDISDKPFTTVDDNNTLVVTGDKLAVNIDDHLLKVIDNRLTVNTTDTYASGDKTRPITANGVETIVGNIYTLLSLI